MKILSLWLFVAVAQIACARVLHKIDHFGHGRTRFENAYVVQFDKSPSTHIDTFRKHLKTHGIDSFTERVVYDFSYFFGVSIHVKTEKYDVGHIVNGPGVIGVFPVANVPGPKLVRKSLKPNHKPSLEAAHNLTGVNLVQSDLHIYGKGVKVGVIDTGLYYPHPAFGVNGKPGCFKGPGCRVQYGFDLVGDSYSAANATVAPDGDPLDDCSQESHGTHVAGIVGANATHITDPNFIPAAPFLGVAPQATLGAYRVFGCPADNTGTDIITQAIFLAAKDGMDIITISIGGGSAWPEEIDAVAASLVAKKGHYVTAAMGNDGGHGLWAGGAPGISRTGYGVAAFDNLAFFQYTIKFASGDTIGYSFGSQFGKPFSNIKAPVIVNNPNAVPGVTADDGCSPLSYNASGTVVMFIQGPICGSKVRCLNARLAGAVGCLVYNDVPGTENIFGDSNIPGGGIQLADGQKIAAIVKQNPSSLFSFTDQQSAFKLATAGTPSGFTSLALDPELHLKPDIGGVGGNVYSTLSPFASNNVGYGTYSGTSMATPYLAGAVALYVQRFGKQATDAVKGHFQNYARPSVVFGQEFLASAAQQGSGLLNAFNTLTAKTTISPATISLNDTTHQKSAYYFTIHNGYSHAVTYQLVHKPASTLINKNVSVSDQLLDNPVLTTDYATVKLSSTKVRIAARHSKSIRVSITAPAHPQDNTLPVFSGFIYATPVGFKAPPAHLTYVGVKGDFHSFPVFVENDSLGNPVTGLYDSNSNPISAPTTVNLTNGLSVITNIATPTAILAAEIVTAAGKPIGFVFDSLQGFPAFLTNVGRNSETAGQSQVLSFPFSWFGDFANSTVTSAPTGQVPPGQYRVIIKALKHFGNPHSQKDYWTYESPVLTVSY